MIVFNGVVLVLLLLLLLLCVVLCVTCVSSQCCCFACSLFATVSFVVCDCDCACAWIETAWRAHGACMGAQRLDEFLYVEAVVLQCCILYIEPLNQATVKIATFIAKREREG